MKPLQGLSRRIVNPVSFHAPLSPSHWPPRQKRPASSWAILGSGLVFAASLLLSLALTACSEQSDSEGGALPSVLPPSVEAPPQHNEFVVLIDNSRSIRPPEQVIIREATMLLADLVDPGDRISVVTFGEGARTVVGMPLTSDRDRDAFKAAVRDQVDFSERFSDIRAGIRVLANEQGQLLPSPNAIRAAVLFSDGKLEPRDGQTKAAFDQMQADLRGPLAGLPVYAVVLGDTSSRQPIPGLTNLTGLDLMSSHVASSPKHFYHARNLEELPDIAVTILNDTKGISSLGEEGGAAFRVDSTVELMTLIVRKRPPGSAGDSDLPASDQIDLAPPEPSTDAGQAAPAPGPESIYRNRDYQHFDLFVVRHPRPGIWHVTLKDGKVPKVLSKIVSPVKLRVQAPEQLYVNEASVLQAWLYDEATKSRVADGYQLQARVAEAGGISSSEKYVDLGRDDASGRSFLALPQAVFEALGKPLEPGRIELEVVARKDGDPWFVRRSSPLSIEVREPLVAWRDVPPIQRPVPGLGNAVVLGGSVDKAAYQKLGFEIPARLRVFVERQDPETGQYARVLAQGVQGADAGERLDYLVSAKLDEYGDYRYGYEYSGPRERSQLLIQSAVRSFRVEPPWALFAGVALAVLMLLELLSALTAKVRGQVQVEKTGINPAFAAVTLTPRKELRSTAVHDIDFGTAGFRVRPSRHLFLFKRLCVVMTGVDATLNNVPLKRGKASCVRARGRHVLRFTHPDGDPVEATLTLKV